jgi:hypothetical protein
VSPSAASSLLTVGTDIPEFMAKSSCEYRWSDGSDGRPRCWYVDVLESDLDAELTYLKAEIYQRDVDINHRAITALDRFSDRV